MDKDFSTEKSPTISNLSPEPQTGNIEYKYKLIQVDKTKKMKLTSQMKWRVFEGDGYATYFVGVRDNGDIDPIIWNEYIETYLTLMGMRIITQI